MGTSFAGMAIVLREHVVSFEEWRARLDPIVSASDVELMRANNAIVAEAANFLASLSPHERMVRELVRVGALVDFPDYTQDLSFIAPGVRGLFLGEVLEVHTEECRASFQAVRGRTEVWTLHPVGLRKGVCAGINLPERRPS